MSEPASAGDLPSEAWSRRTNALAVASLACGLLVCVPLIAGLLAVLLGLLGLWKARDPRVGGRGLAIAGLILGIIGVAGWAIVGVGFARIARISSEARTVSTRFVDDLSRGRVNAALAVAGESYDRAALNSIAEDLRPLGPLQGLSINTTQSKLQGGSLRIELEGNARFSRADRNFRMILRHDETGTRVMHFILP